MNDFGKKTIGILGGMGPSATARFYQIIIDECQKKGLKSNDEYPYILIYNLPVPDLIGDQNKKEITLKMIKDGLKKLEYSGADFVVIPCNTVHLFIDMFRKTVNIPIISLIEETVVEIKEKNIEKVGIIGSKTTITENVYQKLLKGNGIKSLTPKHLDEISNIIKRIVSGENTNEDKRFILKNIEEMVQGGAEGIVLGCTELPLIISQEGIEVPIFNTLEILAKKTVSEVLNIEK